MLSFGRFCAICVALVSASLSFAAEIPNVDIDRLVGTQSVSNALAQLIAKGVPVVPLTPEEKQLGLDRKYRIVPDARIDLGEFQPGQGPSQLSHTRRGDFYDLWSVADSLDPSSHDVSLALSFALTSAKPKRVFLDFGAADSTAIIFQQKNLFTLQGEREIVPGQTLISLDLPAGRSVVTVISSKGHSWQHIPAAHFDDEWTLDLHIYENLATAWKEHCRKIYHPLESPVVSQLQYLRTDHCIAEKSNITLYSLDGKKIIDGVATDDGTFSWDRDKPALKLPFVGIACVGSGISEAVVITGKDSLDAAVAQLFHPTSFAHTDAWAFRTNHLMKAQFTDSRDIWWARKLALSLAMSCLETDPDDNNIAFNTWQAARIRLIEYASKIDGTIQHYCVFRSRGQRAGNIPVAVFLPGFSDPTRPFLESQNIAGLREMESLGITADANGVDVLWPGNIDVDWGGQFAKAWVAEALADFRASDRKHFEAPMFMIGSCASATSALRFADTREGVDGLVLWQPTVKREVARWLPGQPIDDFPYRSPSDENENGYGRIGSRGKLSILVYFDTIGEREGIIKIADQLKTKGVAVDESFPEADKVMDWGVRSLGAESDWMRWIKTNSPSISLNAQRGADSFVGPETTIQNLLLRGLTVASESDAAFTGWVAKWSALRASYRGSIYSRPLPAISGPPNLTFHRLTAQDEEDLKAQRFMVGEESWWMPPAVALSDKAPPIYWGCRLTKDKPSSSVEIFTNLQNPNDPGPNIDLFVDGHCRGMLWRKLYGRWLLACVWP